LQHLNVSKISISAGLNPDVICIGFCQGVAVAGERPTYAPRAGECAKRGVPIQGHTRQVVGAIASTVVD
jgi:hypothetical protein